MTKTIFQQFQSHENPGPTLPLFCHNIESSLVLFHVHSIKSFFLYCRLFFWSFFEAFSRVCWTQKGLHYTKLLLALAELFTIKVSIFRRIALVLLGDEESCWLPLSYLLRLKKMLNSKQGSGGSQATRKKLPFAQLPCTKLISAQPYFQFPILNKCYSPEQSFQGQFRVTFVFWRLSNTV